MLSDYIEKGMNLHGVSQNGLARMMKITGSALSQAKRGDATLNQDSLAKLARICNVKPEEVIADYELNRPHTVEVKNMWKRIQVNAVAICAVVAPLSFLLRSGSVYILCKIRQSLKLREIQTNV